VILPQRSTGRNLTNSGPTVSWETTIRTHSYLSLLVQGDALAGGKSSTYPEIGLIKCWVLRFSEIEQIAALSVIILHYKITVLDEPQYAHETAEERKRRILAARVTVAVKPVRTPIVFTPREGANILAY
jgi:hypothetical protein